ncbi:MAG: dihydroorotate dehydrogenase-like protein [Sphaerochaetaceae bacterium]|jgi:dihydroorotate dehydrogenase (fumarate)|nr:dihydroorotate dehydrogenase-like protein [Sphaerochaetaceae bacterium]MDY0371153.1 dihydroorotate dehydrogenase-like protein [Sphaerochaetaceae bacterium]
MERLTTTYLGLELKNPIIVGSSPLTASLDNLKKCEDAGAGAVVVKSIFEEQIDHDAKLMISESEGYVVHADGQDFLEDASRNYYIDAYLSLVEKATDALDIPVIASVNCRTQGTWLDYVSRFAEVGADALELNYFVLPSDFKRTAEEMETEFIALVETARRRFPLPLSIKMGSQFTALANIVGQLDKIGVDGLVLFNRFYQPNIDIEKIATKASIVLSSPHEYTLPLQWTALLSAYLNCDICASTGIHSGETLIKMLLSGAKAVQVCSAIMKNGHPVITEMLNTLTTWMDRHHAQTFVDFRGKLAHKRTKDPSQWERAQYMKSLNVEF